MVEEPPGKRSGRGAASILRHMVADGRRSGESAETMRARQARSSHTILVVDDVDAHRYAMARRLQEDGFKTIEAATGTDAIVLAVKASAVVLDVNLPDVNGVEVCRTLKAEEPNRPVLLISAVFDDELHQIAAKSAGADAYLSPPPPTSSLTAEIDALLKIPHGQQA
jgi:DNA-binding response OmpR family regulator